MTVTIQPDHRQLGFRVGRRQIRIFSKGLLRSQKRFRRMSLGAKHSRQIQHNLDIRRILVGCRMRSDVFGREMAESEGFILPYKYFALSKIKILSCHIPPNVPPPEGRYLRLLPKFLLTR